MPQAKSDQCLSDKGKIDQLVQLISDVHNQYPDFAGTPSFVINGTLLDKDTAPGTSFSRSSDAALK